MADHLFLSSLQPSPSFLIFPSHLHRPCGWSPRFSLPKLRVSSSTSPSPSSSSDKFNLVSSKQLDDGSHVFQFGDEIEVERYLENEAKLKKENAKLAEEASEEDAKIKPINSNIETSFKEEERVVAPSSNVIKIKDRKRVRSPTKKKKEVSVSVNVSLSEDEVASVSNLSSIVSVPEAIPTSSTAEEVVVSSESEPSNESESTVESLSSEVMEKVSVNEAKVASVSTLSSIVSVSEVTPSGSTEEEVVVSKEYEPINDEKVSVNEIRDCETTNVSRSEDIVEANIASVSNLSSIASVVEATVIPTGSTEENVNVSEEYEQINEIKARETKGSQQVNENRVEVQARPRSSTSQHDPNSYDLKEVAHVSTIEHDDNLDARETPMKTFEAEEELVAESTATATVSPDELISASEATHQSVDEIADTPEENLVIEQTAPASLSPDELISPSEATHQSVDEIAETPVIVTPEEKLAVEPTARATVSPDEVISASEETDGVDEVADTPLTHTSEVANEEENAASAIEDEIAVNTDNGSLLKTVDDTEAEDLQLPAPEIAGLESIEVASDREELVSKAFYWESGFASLQNPFKALTGREDAYFISHNNCLGVADGVSQWSFEGIKKGKYAQELMSNCQKIISDETAKIADPVQVLHRSVDETKSPGSSTALIAHLDNNELHVANIGDSGFMVIRNRKVLQKSSPMFHHFCFPVQITQGDADVLKLAEIYHVNLEEDDVIVTATDGLFDNLYEKEIVAIVCRLLEQSLEPQKIAELVAAKAQEVGRSKTERTPFSDAAKEEGYDGYKGGKLDDVTVIVSIVKTL